MRVTRHFAWFRRDTGAWLGEWQGPLPPPRVPTWCTGGLRAWLLNRWQQRVQAAALRGAYPGASIADREAFAACPVGGAVCLDVTACGFPLGDHRWHVWDDHARSLEAPQCHTFLTIDRATGSIVANQRSTRPLIPQPAHVVLDITDTPLERHYGDIWGRVVRRADGRLTFQPSAQAAAALTEAAGAHDLLQPRPVRETVEVA